MVINLKPYEFLKYRNMLNNLFLYMVILIYFIFIIVWAFLKAINKKNIKSVEVINNIKKLIKIWNWN